MAHERKFPLIITLRRIVNIRNLVRIRVLLFLFLDVLTIMFRPTHSSNYLKFIKKRRKIEESGIFLFFEDYYSSEEGSRTGQLKCYSRNYNYNCFFLFVYCVPILVVFYRNTQIVNSTFSIKQHELEIINFR